MKRLILILIAILTIYKLFAATPADRYFSRMTNEGMLFFIMPQNAKKLDGISSFEYDITMLTWNDSITFNFTYKSKKMDTPQEIIIGSGVKKYSSTECKPLFVDIVKNGFEIRMTSKFLYKDFETIVKNDVPPIFYILQDGKQKSATFSQKAWKKEREILNRILTVYNYSQR